MHLKPILIGRDPLERERRNQDIWRRQRSAGVRVVGAVDVALWDIAGKAFGQPIHWLLGTWRDSISACASSAVLPSAAAYAEKALQFRTAKWAAYKIHPPARMREDLVISEAVRKAVGDDYTLMLDSTWSCDFPTAVRVGLAAQAMDYLRGDVAVKGGITALLKAAHLAEAFRMNLEIHHGDIALNNIANLHVIMAIRNTAYFEVLLSDATQKYGLAEDITVDAQGLVHAPAAPGLRHVLDDALIGLSELGLVIRTCSQARFAHEEDGRDGRGSGPGILGNSGESGVGGAAWSTDGGAAGGEAWLSPDDRRRPEALGHGGPGGVVFGEICGGRDGEGG